MQSVGDIIIGSIVFILALAGLISLIMKLLNWVAKRRKLEVVESPEKFIACYMCLATTGLFIIPYTHKERRVGYIFICKKCYPKLDGKAFRVIVEPKDMDN